MRRLLRIFKWILKSIGLVLGVLILVGLAVRLFGPEPVPPGELIEVGDHKLHINAMGEKNNKPTLVIESGAGAPSEYYYWLGEGLKDSVRVIRYDRAGVGYSEPSDTPRDPENIARELHTLLERAGESPPYILAGHSYGGHYIRVFTKMYPDEVVGLVFLDSPHPDEGKRLNMPKEPWFVTPMYKAGAVLGDLGVLHLFDKMLGPILWAPGLPTEVTDRYTDYTVNGQYLWGYLEEEKGYADLKIMAAQASHFGDLPIRVFSGTNLNEKALQKMGYDPEIIRKERAKMQDELAAMSSNGEVFFLKGGHITIFSLKKNADIICEEVHQLVADLSSE